MISFTSAEFNALLAAYLYPLARILALLASAPPFSNAALPRRIRLAVGLAVALALAPALPKAPAIDPASGLGLLVLAQQMLIGYAMGTVMRLASSAVDFMGTTISTQMGLGFATAYDPQNTSQTPVVSEFLGILALLVFLVSNGHLMLIATLMKSFALLPVGHWPVAPSTWLNVARAGGIVFSSGLLLALPIVVALLITNVALGVLGRVAPQLNLIAIGFPVTILLGFLGLLFGLSLLATPLLQLYEYSLQSMLGVFVLR